jgi:hypothetical protein
LNDEWADKAIAEHPTSNIQHRTPRQSHQKATTNMHKAQQAQDHPWRQIEAKIERAN